MDSVIAYLSRAMIVEKPVDIIKGNIGIVMEDELPILLLDRYQEHQSFTYLQVNNPAYLSSIDLQILMKVVNGNDWIVIVDQNFQVQGVIEPQRGQDLLVGLLTRFPNSKELGGELTSPPGIPDVSVSFYVCPKHPEVRAAMHQVGAPIPYCFQSDCKEKMVILQQDTDGEE